MALTPATVSPCSHYPFECPLSPTLSNMTLPLVTGSNFSVNCTPCSYVLDPTWVAYWEEPVGESSLIFVSFRTVTSEMLLKKKKNTPAFTDMVVQFECDISPNSVWTLDPWVEYPLWKVVELSVGRRIESQALTFYSLSTWMPSLLPDCWHSVTSHPMLLPLCLPHHDGLYHQTRSQN